MKIMVDGAGLKFPLGAGCAVFGCTRTYWLQSRPRANFICNTGEKPGCSLAMISFNCNLNFLRMILLYWHCKNR